MISVKVDQFTLTILPNSKLLSYMNDDVVSYSEHVREVFEQLLEIEEVYSQAVEYGRGVRNYDTVYYYGFEKSQIFYKYNSENISNGISIEFKARALREYLKSYKIKKQCEINVHHILKKLSSVFDIRLSRLDIAIDFIDENLLVSNLANQIKYDEILIKNKGNRVVTNDKIRTLGSSGIVQTIYVNSRTGDSFLRVYDKKEESISKNTIDSFKALNCNDWTRLELELKSTYAHNITKLFVDCDDDNNEFLSLLYGVFIQFFKFFKIITYDDKGYPILEYADFYQHIIDSNNSEITHVDGHESNNATEFDLKYQNLFKNGTMTFLKMFYVAYGEDAFDELVSKMKKDMKERVKLNKDHKTMIKNHKNDDPFFKK